MAVIAKQLQQIKDQIDNLPAKQYFMALALIILGVIRFVFMPWQQDLNQQQRELEQLSSVIKKPELMTSQLERIKSELLLLEADREFWQGKFYQGDENQIKITFAQELNNWIKDFDLNLLRSKWGRVSKKQREEYTQLGILKYDITVRAEYKNLLNFIAFVQQQTPLVDMGTVSISKRNKVGIATTTISFSVLYKEVK